MPLETVHVLTNVAGGPTTDGKGIVMVWTLRKPRMPTLHTLNRSDVEIFVLLSRYRHAFVGG
jgi:hypothetical protein